MDINKIKKKTHDNYVVRNIVFFCLLYSLAYIGRFLVSENVTIIGEEVEFTKQMEKFVTTGVLVSYAIGSILNGFISDKIGSKKCIGVGVGVSILGNLLISLSWNPILIIFIYWINGYFQSLIWIGGMIMLAQWIKPLRRGFFIGLFNSISGIAHLILYISPMVLLAVSSMGEWRTFMKISMAIWLILLLLFEKFTLKSPEEVGYIALDPQKPEYEKETIKAKFNFYKGKKLIYWCTIAFLSSICRYGLLNWLPIHLEEQNTNQFIDDVFLIYILPFAMAIGTFVIAWLGGKWYYHNLGFILVWISALGGTLILILSLTESAMVIAMSVFFTGFLMYGINGLLWVYALRTGGRSKAGLTVGVINGFAYIGASTESYIFPAILKMVGSSIGIFITLEIIAFVLMLLGIAVMKKNTTIVAMVRE